MYLHLGRETMRLTVLQTTVRDIYKKKKKEEREKKNHTGNIGHVCLYWKTAV